jgi:hypothetical protein
LLFKSFATLTAFQSDAHCLEWLNFSFHLFFIVVKHLNLFVKDFYIFLNFIWAVCF